MYNPPHFEETRPEVLRDLIAAHPLGALVTLGSTGLDANHIPFEFAAGDGSHGTLRGQGTANSAAMAGLVRDFGKPNTPS